MKTTITKKLVIKNEDGAILITDKEVSAFAPLNRVLDEVGWYQFEVASINKIAYVVVFETTERESTKTKILVSRLDSKSGRQGQGDMTSKDAEALATICNHYLEPNMGAMN